MEVLYRGLGGLGGRQDAYPTPVFRSAEIAEINDSANDRFLRFIAVLFTLY